MALQVKCKKGHTYIQGDIYVDWPDGAPACPECLAEWRKKKGLEFTVEVVYQPVDGTPRKDIVRLGLGDHYSTGLQNAGFLFKIIKVNIPAMEFFEQDGSGQDTDNGAG